MVAAETPGWMGQGRGWKGEAMKRNVENGRSVTGAMDCRTTDGVAVMAYGTRAERNNRMHGCGLGTIALI